MKKRLLTGFTVSIVAALLLAGCGSYSDKAATTEEVASADDYSDDVYAYAESSQMMDNSAESSTDAGSLEESLVNENRKLIKSVNMNVETEEFDNLLTNVEQRITALGGYAETKEINGNGSYYSDEDDYWSGNRSAYIVARIPSNKLDQFVNTVTEQSNVINKQESVDDVTLQYVDVESHRDSLKVEQERLNELLGEADNLESIIALEERLTEVRYELENFESQLRTMDNQVDYSTVTLNISEVERYTPPVEKSAWNRMSTGFAESMYNVGNGLQNFAIGFVIALPYLLIFAILIAIVAGIVILIVKASEKSYKKKINKPVSSQPAGGENSNDKGTV